MGTTESTAIKIEWENNSLIRFWEEYLHAFTERERLIAQLPASFGQKRQTLLKLRGLFDIYLINIKKAEKDEKDLLINLEALEHSKKIKRIHRLEACLGYAETEYHYVYELLAHLYHILKSEVNILKELMAVKDLRKYRNVCDSMHSEFEVEKTIVNKISRIKNFQGLFAALVRGEHIIHTMDAQEKKLLIEMRLILANKLQNETITEWAFAVYEAVQDLVMDHEAILAQGYDPHPDVDFEFVNRSSFIEFVKKKYPGRIILPPQTMTQMVNVFVHVFREMYNHGRD